jgi:E3 ubiquitin-protein ligase TRIP12
LYEIVTLVNELLPATPDTQGNQVSPTSIVGTSSRGAGRKYSAVTIGKVEESGQGATPEISAREMLLRNQPELLLQFGTDLFPLLVLVKSALHSGDDWRFLGATSKESQVPAATQIKGNCRVGYQDL